MGQGDKINICSECGREMAEPAQIVHDVTVKPPRLMWQICAACVRPGENMILRARAWVARQSASHGEA